MSEHVYCVAVTFEITEQLEQHMHIKFCVKMEYSSVENIGLDQKATAMGNW